ncbi:hypothetical protein, partial [Rhodoplanes sp. SY1]|uniref:hypothetical protein n=1 Tax=Rhodoplanes sp. SY1 TaxID=3166646 RepID=UPI0038B58FCA
DGGQWTDEDWEGPKPATESNPHFLSDGPLEFDRTDWAQYVANKRRGHHFMPQSIYTRLPLPDEAFSVFDNATTGALFYEGNNVWDEAHRVYRDAVYGEFKKYLDENKIDIEKMTADQARSFLRAIERSADPRIRNFNRMVRMRELICGYRSRFIFRGNE